MQRLFETATDDAELREIICGAFAGKRIELFKEHCESEQILRAVEAVLAK